MIQWLKAGNVAVITGGGNGIGLAAAEHYLGAGMKVVIADINEEALSAAAEQLSAAAEKSNAEPGQLKTRVCDVSEIEQVAALRDFVRHEFGQVDCLMNNAGAAVTRGKPWEDLEGWRKQLDINLWGIINGCHAFVPSMLESSRPVAIINTGSKQGITNPPGGYAYNLSKAGVVNYTQSLAHALREETNCPISVHLLIPGFTYSNMIARFVAEQPSGAWTSKQVIDFMLQSVEKGDFAILCPDNDTPRAIDEKRIQWGADDMIQNRPALSRWHPDFSDEYQRFMEE